MYSNSTSMSSWPQYRYQPRLQLTPHSWRTGLVFGLYRMVLSSLGAGHRWNRSRFIWRREADLRTGKGQDSELLFVFAARSLSRVNEAERKSGVTIIPSSNSGKPTSAYVDRHLYSCSRSQPQLQPYPASVSLAISRDFMRWIWFQFSVDLKEKLGIVGTEGFELS